MPPKRNNCRFTHMTEEEREAVAREAAARDREVAVANNWITRREKDWAVACESAAREAEVRETRAQKRLIEKWRKTNPPCFTHPLNHPFF